MSTNRPITAVSLAAGAAPSGAPRLRLTLSSEDSTMQAVGFEIEMEQGVAIIRLAGPEVNHLQMLEINDACGDKLRYDGVKAFLFDLSNVELFASACVGALVELLREVEPTRGRIALCGCSENVSFLFRVTRLDDIFTMFDDLEDAVHELGRDCR